MDDHTFKHIKLTGTSDSTMEDAVSNALDKASSSVRNMRWFELVDTRGTIENGKVDRWQVTIEVGVVTIRRIGNRRTVHAVSEQVEVVEVHVTIAIEVA